MDKEGPIAILGAGGKTGTLVVERAIAAGMQVRALEHNLPDAADRIEGADYRQCDVLNDDLEPMLNGCGAVISALGVAFAPRTAIDPPPLCIDGTARVLRAMRKTGVDRIAVISAAFVVHQPSVPSWFRFSVVPAIHKILEDMKRMEGLLEAEPNLKWTAARPGWLIDLPLSGEADVEAFTLPQDCFRCRHADLAEFLVDAIRDGSWVGQKPAIGKPEADEDESLIALKDELETMFGNQ